MLFPEHSDDRPVVAILRGVTPGEILDVSAVLLEAGYRYIEVPLNSPQALESIARLCDRYGDDCVCGAGTVLTEAQMEAVAETGARIALAPDMKPSVIKTAAARNIAFVPGVATPTEAFAALDAGAAALKLFPAVSLGTEFLKAVRAVLPPDAQSIAVGGVTEENFLPWLKAGAAGFGIGGNLYKPGIDLPTLRERADRLLRHFDEAQRAAKENP